MSVETSRMLNFIIRFCHSNKIRDKENSGMMSTRTLFIYLGLLKRFF